MIKTDNFSSVFENFENFLHFREIGFLVWVVFVWK